MKKNRYIQLILVIAVSWLTACENQPIEFDDYGSTACYFPYQTPARSLILGNYNLGLNENDNNHLFEIGVTMSGVYENVNDRRVYFEVDESLLNGVANVVPLPPSYYAIETASPVTIPAGSIKGRIRVQLTDAFFDDTLSLAPIDSVNYVIPLVINNVEGIDTILQGVAADGISDPVKTDPEDWAVQPKDYTLYGIKFINKYHGNYLRRGVDQLDTFNIATSSYETDTTIVYHKDYVERDEVVMVSSSSLNAVVLSNSIRRGDLASPGDIELLLTFDANENCQVFDHHTSEEIGEGEFVENGDSWGGESRDVIHMEYTFLDTINNEMHYVTDTLVMRDRAVVFEEFTIYVED